jgi:non-canonical (house-cleaning) NTP pyrophosphatase
LTFFALTIILKLKPKLVEMEGKVHVFVGSMNLEKQKCVLEAFTEKFSNVEVIACDVDSGVKSQPIGLEETMQGATNRKDGAKIFATTFLRDSKLSFAVGLENGIIPFRNKGICFDQGVVVIENLINNLTTISLAPGLQLPMKVEEDWEDDMVVKVYHDTLWGKIHRKGADWYQEMTLELVSRKEALYVATKLALGQLLYLEK